MHGLITTVGPAYTAVYDIRARGCKLSMLPFTLVICTGNGEGKGQDKAATSL